MASLPFGADHGGNVDYVGFDALIELMTWDKFHERMLAENFDFSRTEITARKERLLDAIEQWLRHFLRQHTGSDLVSLGIAEQLSTADDIDAIIVELCMLASNNPGLMQTILGASVTQALLILKNQQ